MLFLRCNTRRGGAHYKRVVDISLELMMQIELEIAEKK